MEAVDHQRATTINRVSMMMPNVNDISCTQQHYSDIDEEIEIDHEIDIDTSSNLIPSSVAMISIANDDYDGPCDTKSLSIRESAQAIAASRIFGASEEDDAAAVIAAANRDCQNCHHNDVDNDSDDEEFEILPNLANLVAASLRDRVVLEQMEEIKLLKKQLKASRKVEITGKDGIPVYARGDFTKGQFNWDVHSCGQGHDVALGGPGVFWDVGLKMKRFDDEMSIPLQNLKHIEIRIGGVLYCTSEEVEGVNMALGIRPGNRFDHKRVVDMKRSVVCEFNPEDDSLGRNAFLTFHMTGFPRDSWRSLQSVAMLNRSNALLQQRREEEREERREARQRERLEVDLPPIDDNEWEDSDDEEDEESEPFDVYRYIAHSLSRRHPEQRANFTSVSFCVKSVRSKIKQLRTDCALFEDERSRAFKRLDEIREEEAMMAEYE
uniref:Uncharacterized protein n=1 Tax=Skeletonema marinoi TaxID=267567 RepID=A0A7S1CTD9_9STRA|mmetsp:Transcript_1469/g.2161  ORF Transcript_1469/g.2161 Transcript_1469/m.2161 type:complete len:437 (+) Transcript_1469:49-1359(+)